MTAGRNFAFANRRKLYMAIRLALSPPALASAKERPSTVIPYQEYAVNNYECTKDMRLRKQLTLFGILCFLSAALLVIAMKLFHVEIKQDYVLSLSVRNPRLSKADFFDDKAGAKLFFSNNTTEPLEFMTNGSFFQYIDIRFLDKTGNDCSVVRYGDAHIIRASRDKREVVSPGETTGGTFSLQDLVRGKDLQGTYHLQAFLNYEGFSVSSNIVELNITP